MRVVDNYEAKEGYVADQVWEDLGEVTFKSIQQR